MFIMHANDHNKWNPVFTIQKFNSEESLNRGVPDDVQVIHGNLLLSEGINFIWSRVCSSTGTVFDATHAFIGVGSSNTAAQKTQTGLLGSDKLYKGMDSGYPRFGTNDKTVFKSTFGPSDANFVWAEWTVANGNGTTSDASNIINLNRKVEPMGEKYSGSTWVITVEISLT